MLGIKINNGFLDIPSGVLMELQRNNPMLSTDEIEGEYSFPISVRYTENNYRLFQFVGNWYKVNSKYTVDAEIYDNGQLRYTGKLVIINHTGNLLNPETLTWNVTIYLNSSSFMQDIRDVYLKDIDLGGDRSFPFTGYDIDDDSGGFWQHIHEARTPNAFPYTFYPVKNPSWKPEEPRWNPDYAGWMNRLNDDGNFQYDPDGVDNRPNIFNIVPSIYVKYILERIAAHKGWKLTGDMLNDTGFNKLTQVGTRAIEWIERRSFAPTESIPSLWFSYTLKDEIIFNLKDFVPQNITCEQYLINLKNRLGLKIDFDSISKTLSINPLKLTIYNQAKDWSKYALTPYIVDYKETVNKYSLINNIDSDDTFPLSANIDPSKTIAAVENQSMLPAPADTADGAICYSYKENIYWINEWDEDIHSYKWNLLSHNIGNREVADANKTFTSDFSTMPTIPQVIRPGVKALIPTCDKQGNHAAFKEYTEWAVRLLFYHGMVNDEDGQPYPYASCHSSDNEGNNDLTPWSLPYERRYADLNNGVYDYFFKDYLSYIQKDDVRTMVFALPVHELLTYSWADRIRINNAEFIAESYKEIVPYKGLVEFKLKRVF